MSYNPPKTWLALIIGNSRLHWGLFNQETILKAWDTNYLTESTIKNLSKSQILQPIFPYLSSPFPPLFIASVVPAQTKLWQNYPHAKFMTLDEIPLKKLYPTLGIDRALSLLGAGETCGFPILVMDAGTALTFTGADNHRNLIGGAILPGLGLQFSTLTHKTGKLPNVDLPQKPPQKYAFNTSEAIQSGIIYTLLAGIKDFIEAWWCNFPESKVIFTGGDSSLLFSYLNSQFPEIAMQVIIEKNLVLWGMQKIIT